MKSPETEQSKPPVKMEQRGRILGIGGVFFKSANRDQMREWYSKHLGLADKGGGVMLPWREHDDPQKERVTVWTVFPASTKYLDPSPAPFMINYIVDDMDALLERLKEQGVKIDDKRMNESFGKFAWILDNDRDAQPSRPHPLRGFAHRRASRGATASDEARGCSAGPSGIRRAVQYGERRSRPEHAAIARPDGGLLRSVGRPS